MFPAAGGVTRHPGSGPWVWARSPFGGLTAQLAAKVPVERRPLLAIALSFLPAASKAAKRLAKIGVGFLGFVEAHLDKKFLSRARAGDAGLFLYIITPDHPSYLKFQQHRIERGRIPGGSQGFFARARVPGVPAAHARARDRSPPTQAKCFKAVNVAPGTPGIAVVQFTWPEGPDGDPVAVLLYGDLPHE